MEDEDGLYDFEGIADMFETIAPDDDNDTVIPPKEDGLEVENNDDEIKPKEIDSDENLDLEDIDDKDEVEDETEPDEFGSDYDAIIGVLRGYNQDYEIPEDLQSELDAVEDEDDKKEKYLEIQRELKERDVDERVSSLIEGVNPEIKPLLDIALNGGKLEDVLALAKGRSEISKITKDQLVADKDLQIKEVTEDLKSKGLSDKRVKVLIDSLEAEDELEMEAIKALDGRNAKQAEMEKAQAKTLEASNQKRQADYQKWENDVDAYVKNVKEIVPGKVVTKKDQEAIKDAILSREDTIDGPMTKFQIALKKDPIGLNVKINYLLNSGVFEDEKSWDSLFSSNRTKQTKKVISNLKVGGIKGKGSKATKTTKVTDLVDKFFK